MDSDPPILNYKTVERKSKSASAGEILLFILTPFAILALIATLWFVVTAASLRR